MRGNGDLSASRIARARRCQRLVPLLLLGCTTATVPQSAPSAPTASRNPASSAELFADVVGKVHQQYVDGVPVARLTVDAIRGLETVAPKSAIRVAAVGNGATITHGESESSDSRLSVAWSESPTPADAGRVLDEASRFVVRRLNASPPEVFDALVRGLMRFDPEGAYLARTEQAELSGAEATGSVGLELTQRGREPMIAAPFPGGPGDRTGLRAGDRIRAVDGVSTDGMNLADVVRLLRGLEGSRTVLTVTRADWPEPRNVTITREVIRAPSVEYRALSAQVGYVWFRGLQKTTVGELRDAVRALRGRNVNAIVLDLRGNVGGLLSAAIEVAELFLPEGRLITSTNSQARQYRMRFLAQPKPPVVDWPLVVLIDEGTAAGAQIVAAALQDWERATLVGTKSVGRTTVQSIILLPNGARLRLTTARWFTPKGRSLEHTGLTPDLEILRGEDDDRWFRDPERDSQLRRAIQVVAAKRVR